MRIGADELLRRLEARGFAGEASSLAPLTRGAAEPESDDASAVPARVGPFEIIGELGQGAYGTVLLGAQERPVRRLAAIKLLKQGMDSRSVLARFRGEQQALALMDHAAVATVFESGLAEDGRPWFAMPLVTGVSLTQHADLERLGLQRRLELFLEAAAGVAHAHQKGVIHRDLKPANILVGVEGEREQPRVIDFGIAKAVEGADPLTSLATLDGSPLGTPAYMAPEQVRGIADTRSDVWSLGVVLGELLCGWRPLDREPSRRDDGTIQPGSFRRPSEILRERLRVDPVAARQVSGLRGMAPASLAAALAGDLDAIVGRCLEEEPDRRYPSVESLVEDIQRHLQGRAIEARPPSAVYLLRRFVRRHAILVGAATTVVAAMAVATLLSVRAAARAEAEARAAEAVTGFLVDMLGSADPWRPGGTQDLTVREVLQTAERKLASGAVGERSLERARLTLAVGLARLQLGMAAEALPSLEAAESQMAALVPGTDMHAEAIHRLGAALQALGRPAEAIERIRRARSLREGLQGPESTAAIRVMNDEALALLDAGQPEAAESVLRLALDRLRRTPTPDPVQLAGTQGNLGMLLQATGRLEEARPFVMAALQTNERRLGPDDLELAMDWNNLGLLQKDLGEHEPAERSLRRSLEILERGLGRKHPSFALVQVNLADLLQRIDRLDEAIALLQEAQGTVRSAYGDLHPELARVSNQMGFVQLGRGDRTGAESAFRTALQVWESALGAEHPDVATACNNVARVLQEQGRLKEAMEFSGRAVAVASRTMPESDPRRWVFLGRQGSILLGLGSPEAAAVQLESALEGLRRVSAPTSRLRPVLQDLERSARARMAKGEEGAKEVAARWRSELDAIGSD
jgi:tetratricopeptide (TPR) repeat protein